MKIEDVPKGARILIPCVECGTKRSIKFVDIPTYKRDKERRCTACANVGKRRGRQLDVAFAEPHAIRL